MKVKLDENLGTRGRWLFEDAGHDVATVAGQGLAGAPDPRIAEVCGREGRVLITLDLGFANPFQYPPSLFAGIAVLRLSRRVELNEIHEAISMLLARLSKHPIVGKLWIVEIGRIREYEPDASD